MLNQPVTSTTLESGDLVIRDGPTQLVVPQEVNESICIDLGLKKLTPKYTRALRDLGRITIRSESDEANIGTMVAVRDSALFTMEAIDSALNANFDNPEIFAKLLGEKTKLIGAIQENIAISSDIVKEKRAEAKSAPRRSLGNPTVLIQNNVTNSERTTEKPAEPISI